MWVCYAKSLPMMELELIMVKRSKMKHLLPTKKGPNLSGFVIPNRDKASFHSA